MGITIHYRGTMNDLAKIEELEDRVLDITFALGGRATIWRSFGGDDPLRVIRGLMLEMSPGHETMSLLMSPEGHLINLFEIEAAEKEPTHQPSDCFVKTQFGSVQGHIAIVHLLDTLKHLYFDDLWVDDESGYFEHRDPEILIRKMRQLGAAIRSLGEGLQEYGLSDEAAEDPAILANRIESVARLVQEKMTGGSTGLTTDGEQPVADEFRETTLEEEVESMDLAYRKNQRRREEMSRCIAEATASGHSSQEAFELALREQGLEPPKQQADEPVDCGEPWLESLDSNSFGDRDHTPHPAVEQAEELLVAWIDCWKDVSTMNSFADAATRGMMDVVGGLVQATCADLEDKSNRAHAIVQLRRALKGHAFARAAVFGLKASGQIDEETANRFHERLQGILKSLHSLMSAAWLQL